MKIAIICAYNEQDHIAEVINSTRKYVDKIIVVDDGSSDNTSTEALKTNTTVLKHITNMGKGLALQTGFEAALRLNPDYIITIDADGQHDPAEIPVLIKETKDKNLDIIIGQRKRDKNMPLLFKVGNGFLYKTFKAFFKLDIKDAQSGFRVFKPSVYNKIKWTNSGYEAETEMLARAGKLNLKVGECPITTKYLDKFKGTTPIDGLRIFVKMILWRLGK